MKFTQYIDIYIYIQYKNGTNYISNYRMGSIS